MSPCRRPSTFSIPKSLPFYVSTLLEGPKGLKRSTPSTPALPLPAILSSRNGPPLESPIPRNSAAGSHAEWPPTWRSLASNAIPLPGPVLMLTVPAATFLLVLLPVTFSNLPSLQMMSAFLHRKAQRPPISHLLSTSHPPLATKAESAKSSRPNKKIPALPMLLLSMASSSLFCSVTSFGRLHLRAPPLAHFSRLAFLSSHVKIHWRKPSNFHRFLWNIVSTCPSLHVPLYRQPNTLGWPYLDAPIDPGDQWSSDTFLPLRNLLMLLPNFMPSAVQELLQTFQINGTHFYNLSALTHLREKGILPGTRSDDMTSLYDWPLEWEPRASLDSPFFSSLQSSDAENWQLLRKLGGHFLKRLIAALLAPNGHFPSLLLSTLWGIQGGFTSLCVQGIFGSGKTYCASLLLVLVSTVLQLPTVLTAEPNLPLATAAETISDLLRDAPEESRAAYARVLAYGVPKLTPIDVLPIDRPKLFQADSPLSS